MRVCENLEPGKWKALDGNSKPQNMTFKHTNALSSLPGKGSSHNFHMQNKLLQALFINQYMLRVNLDIYASG